MVVVAVNVKRAGNQSNSGNGMYINTNVTIQLLMAITIHAVFTVVYIVVYVDQYGGHRLSMWRV